MQVADSRMIASVGSRMRGLRAVLDPDVAGGVHHNTTHGDLLDQAIARRPRSSPVFIADVRRSPCERCTDRASQPALGCRRSVAGVDNRAEVREFLISRRAKITPQQAGLPDVGARRVPGLRRGEVAALAGVSIEYYAKLERGALAGVSASVLDAIARALQLDDAERAHLFHLAHAADGTSAIMRPRRRATKHGRPGRPCNGPWTRSPPARRSSATAGWTCSPPTISAGPCTHPSTTATPPAHRTSPATPSWTTTPTGFYPDWDLAADTCVAILRTEAGRDPHDKGLHDLVGELSTRSEDFRRRWSAHDVRLTAPAPSTSTTTSSATSTLAYESLDMVSEPGLTLTIYAAEPASPTADALALLASWAAAHTPAAVQPT